MKISVIWHFYCCVFICSVSSHEYYRNNIWFSEFIQTFDSLSGLVVSQCFLCGLWIVVYSFLLDASFRFSSIIYLSIRHYGSRSSKSRGESKQDQRVTYYMTCSDYFFWFQIDSRRVLINKLQLWLSSLVWSFLNWSSCIPTFPLCWHATCISSREEYSQFLKEMIIQPGIAKANLGLSREDVTMEDHVSRSQFSPVIYYQVIH